ncbi:Protein of uncharacterised function (DUF2637) [Mycobacteroides abscessus subsp. massiliense]|uniref:DUF2637 domain-containing protein n=1 Tax=Mycobacteriaceae TaxID=1762 RepID=UPI0009A74B57|nr:MULTISPECIES: DUF2637 domain-containing protein [Mycobacteriaceae]MCW1823175.1 DUF2637 domain-containing protein [Mycolicibacterium senegalense]SLG53791.1 Protein of uncharacterised function (DUF2637) [Mycobacteroides abscessus subsp. massiliense]SLH95399.1 Protein of uncharacterised function (DUF2637) [Mycobacteroides abscessus subsp. massiliense]
MTTDRHAFTALLLGCTAVSLAGNIAYVVERGAVTPVSIALAAVAPILLPVGVHYIPKANRVRRGARFVVTVAVMVAAVAAFVLSFEALSGLMRMHGHGGWTAYLLPVAVDVLAAAAAYALVVEPEAAVVARRGDAAIRDASADPEPATQTAPAATSPLDAPVRREAPAPTQPVDAPPVRDADPARVATQTDPPRDMETDEPATRDATQELALRDADTEEIPLTSTASRDATAARRDAEAPTRRLTAVPPVRRDADDAASPATQTDPLRDAPSGDEFLLRATQLVDAGRTKAPVAVVHRVLRGKATGVPNRELAEQVAISESAVQRIAKADRELAEASA